MLIGYLPTWAIYFPTYEAMKSIIETWAGKIEWLLFWFIGCFLQTITIIIYKCVWIDLPPTSPSVHVVSAMTAGAGTSVATNPVWILKTRFMTQTQYTYHQYTGIADAVKQIWQHEGLRGFYKGLGISLVGVTHVAVQFPLYERLKLLMSTSI